jgi:hypothetical protein
VSARSETHNKNTCLGITKPGNRLPPIFFVFIGFAFNPRNFLTPFNKAGTFTALDDFFV